MKQCYDRTVDGLFEEEMKRALGTVIIECSNFFTVNVQPIQTDEGLAYAISQYGNEGLVLVRDDDYPDMELPEWCSSEFLPLGLRKAAALSGILHAENIERFGIDENADEEAYTPQEPYYVYLELKGQSLPLDERALNCIRKIADSKIFEIASGLAVCSVLCAAGGALLAILHDGNMRGYMYAGALMGVACYLIGLIRSH